MHATWDFAAKSLETDSTDHYNLPPNCLLPPRRCPPGPLCWNGLAPLRCCAHRGALGVRRLILRTAQLNGSVCVLGEGECGARIRLRERRLQKWTVFAGAVTSSWKMMLKRSCETWLQYALESMVLVESDG